MAKDAKKKVALLGFRDGSLAPTSDFEDDHYVYVNVDGNSTEVNLKDFTGVIVPTGAFEEIRKKSGLYGGYECLSSPAVVNHWTREILVNYGKGQWLCLLVDDIIDRIATDYQGYDTVDISNVDLIKRLLAEFRLTARERTKPITPLESKADEFRKYFERFGVAHTAFNKFLSLKEQGELKNFVDMDRFGISFCLDAKLFVLPIDNKSLKSQSVQEAVGLIGAGIYSFRTKNKLNIPEWLDSIHFAEEVGLQRIYDDAMNRATEAQQRKEILRQYKGILTNSNANLCKILSSFLTNEFSFIIDENDKFIQDFTILEPDGKTVIAVCESKGVNRGVVRDNITQVDSHRNRLEIPPEVPGVLFINDFMEVESLEERLTKKVDGAHIKKAVNDNVLIVRTSDLLKLYLSQQNETTSERRETLLKFFRAGGGQLKFSEEEFRVITS